MFDTAQEKIRDAILAGELKVGDTVAVKGSSRPVMVIDNILESPAGKVARCKGQGLYPLQILKKAE